MLKFLKRWISPPKRQKLDKTNRNERALFADRSVTYPSDEIGGTYMDLTGQIVEEGGRGITVETAKGTFRAFYGHPPPEESLLGSTATIRCYDWGGGWYPDNRVLSVELGR